MSQSIRLHRQQQGEGAPLLLLHGLGADHRDWRAVTPVLAGQRRIIAPDLRGHGASPRPRGRYNPWRLARDVLALLDEEGVDTTPVVGHSMGGAVAMSLALLAPQRVTGLVIANSVPSFRPQRLRELGEVALRVLMTGLLGPATLGAVMARRMYPEATQAAQRDLVRSRSAGNSRRVYLGSLMGLTRWSVRHRLAELAVPTLVVASGHDYFRIEDMRAFAEALPRGELTLLPEARHGVPLEQGGELAGLIRDFLQAHRL